MDKGGVPGGRRERWAEKGGVCEGVCREEMKGERGV